MTRAKPKSQERAPRQAMSDDAKEKRLAAANEWFHFRSLMEERDHVWALLEWHGEKHAADLARARREAIEEVVRRVRRVLDKRYSLADSHYMRVELVAIEREQQEGTDAGDEG